MTAFAPPALTYSCHACTEPKHLVRDALVCWHCDRGCLVEDCPRCALVAKSQGSGPRSW